MSDHEPSTTGYAILGLLGVRPWSAYDLTRQVERGLRWFWPRSGNKLYEIPKRLEALGLARSSEQATGRRRRSVYAATTSGREAMRRWLQQPSAPPTLEAEALVRVLFADQGTREDLLNTLGEFREHVLDLQDVGGRIGADYAGSGGGPFPERLHVNALIFEFLWRYSDALLSWAEWAIDEVREWDDVGDQPARRAELLQRYAQIASQVAARGRASAPSGSGIAR